MTRCKWCNLNNPLYVSYHDIEWGNLHIDDEIYLFEMLILESFQPGLSWKCVLNKREDFRKAFDSFDPNIISKYDQSNIDELMNNKRIIRNRLKILAAIENAKAFLKIEDEYNSFKDYLLSFIKDRIIYESDKATNHLSDEISKDLIKRGMKFVGSTIIYSYLQAIGLINSHEKDCFLHKEES